MKQPIEIAREALSCHEVARTGVTNPVNGTAPYSWVRFHGQVVTFSDGEFTCYADRTAGTEKASAYAQCINDALLDLATRAIILDREQWTAERAALVDENARLLRHIRHMANWITRSNKGLKQGPYSFEALGEDLASIGGTDQ